MSKKSLVLVSIGIVIVLGFLLIYPVEHATNPKPASRFVDPLSSKDFRQVKNGKELPEILQSIFIAGDPGTADRKMLLALEQTVRAHPAPSTILFPGDLIYYQGLAPEGSSEAERSRRRINRIIEYGKRSGGYLAFIPGNHDWNNMKAGGLAAVKRLGGYIAKMFGEQRLFPGNGCPGPVSIPSNGPLNLIALDTHRMLEQDALLQSGEDFCGRGEDLSSYLKRGMEIAMPRMKLEDTLLVFHHPLVTYGAHGSNRAVGDCKQESACPRYKEMVSTIVGSLDGKRPLICASGHDHSLQIIRTSKGCKYSIVSGTMSNTTPVLNGPGTIYAKQARGFVRIDRLKDERTIATVFVEDDNAPEGVRVDFSTELTESAPA